MSVELHLEDDEFDLLAAANWHCIGGYTPARQSLTEKMSEVFFQLHGASCDDVISSGVSRLRVSDWIDASVVAETIAEYHAADVEGYNHTVSFRYHGHDRVVAEPVIADGKLSGVEVLKDGRRSDTFKHFFLDEIES